MTLLLKIWKVKVKEDSNCRCPCKHNEAKVLIWVFCFFEFTHTCIYIDIDIRLAISWAKYTYIRRKNLGRTIQHCSRKDQCTETVLVDEILIPKPSLECWLLLVPAWQYAHTRNSVFTLNTATLIVLHIISTVITSNVKRPTGHWCKKEIKRIMSVDFHSLCV